MKKILFYSFFVFFMSLPFKANAQDICPGGGYGGLVKDPEGHMIAEWLNDHGGSKKNLLGLNPDEETMNFFSNELQVTKKTPPCFLAHALNDDMVPPENSQMFYDALIKNKVEAQYLKLPSGNHGLNGYKGPMWEKWKTDCLLWLEKINMCE